MNHSGHRNTESKPARARRRAAFHRPGLFGLAVLAAVVACEGDTLYDLPAEPGDPQQTAAPIVSIVASVPERVELTEELRAEVVARGDGPGGALRRIGLTRLAVHPVTGDTAVEQVVQEFDPASAAVETLVDAFTPPLVQRADLPEPLLLELHAYAVDASGQCSAVTPDLDRPVGCRPLEVAGQTVTVAEPAVAALATLVVPGRSVALPAGSYIADVLPDPTRGRVFLSNQPRNRVEVLGLDDYAFRGPVAVGAQPWGLAFNRTLDSLMVANSGGTSISFVHMGAGQPVEDVARRYRTPNLVLFNVHISFDTLGFRRLNASFHDFSDRPQFLAQDAQGRLLFSTLPTGAAPDGTIRVAVQQSGWAQPEARLLLVDQGSVVGGTTSMAIGNVDSLRVHQTVDGDDLIQIFDHRNGFPNQVIQSGIVSLEQAVTTLSDHPDSDIIWAWGRWSLERVGLSDTTFIAASANRQRVAFGEGAAQHGRVVLWDATSASISNEITTADLVGNASERILGVDLNADGSLGVARGLLGAYYFTSDLRLQGSGPVPATASGGAGGVLHPDHPTYGGESGSSTLSYVATPERTVRIYDTVHFTERGEIPIRNNIVGPLRVSAPPAADLTNCGDACPVAKLYGVTDTGAVVVLDVLPQHIGPAF